MSTEKVIELQAKVRQLENVVHNLEAENKTFHLVSFELEQKRAHIHDLERDIHHLREQLSKLSAEKKQVEINCCNQLNENFFKSRNTVSLLQEEVSEMKLKFKSFSQATSYIRNLENVNILLANEITKLKEKHKTDLLFEHDNFKEKICGVMMRCLDMMKNIKATLHKNTLDQISNSTKLLLLHNTLLSDELNKNSLMIEELLVRLKQKDNTIRALNIDRQINQEFKETLVTSKTRVGDVFRSVFTEEVRNGKKSTTSKTASSLDKEDLLKSLRKSTDNFFRKSTSSLTMGPGSQIQNETRSVKLPQTDTKMRNTNLSSTTNNFHRLNEIQPVKTIEVFIESLRTVLLRNNLTHDIIERIEDPTLREILMLVLNYFNSSTTSGTVEKAKKHKKNTKMSHSNSKSILDYFENYLDKSPVKVVKFKIV